MGLRFAANLNRLWREHPPTDRFAIAAAHGFEEVEFLFPREHDIAALERAITRADVHLTLMDGGVGRSPEERGLLGLPGREEEFLAYMAEDLDLARRLNVPYVNALVGRPGASSRGDISVQTAVDNLRRVVSTLDSSAVTILVEFINEHDAPGYGLRSLPDAVRVVTAVDDPRVRLQFDQYHVARSGLAPVTEFARLQDLVAYVQVADVRGRHEPNASSAVVPFLKQLQRAAYTGVVGLEYDPSTTTEASLSWLSHLMPADPAHPPAAARPTPASVQRSGRRNRPWPRLR